MAKETAKAKPVEKTKPPEKPKPDKPKIYACLEKIDIPEKEKRWVTAKYSEEDAKNALEWVLERKNDIKTTMVQFYKGSLKNRPWEDEIKAHSNGVKVNLNKKLSFHHDGRIVNGWSINCCEYFVMFDHKQKLSSWIDFDDICFEAKFKEKLTELGFE